MEDHDVKTNNSKKNANASRFSFSDRTHRTVTVTLQNYRTFISLMHDGADVEKNGPRNNLRKEYLGKQIFLQFK